jgi:uncharacterized protein YjbJ (UPF0337 family)
MNEDRVKGTINEILGKAKRKIGQLTDDPGLQVEGIAQQVKGKLENTWGKTKEVVRAANEEAAVQHETRIEVALECSTAEADRSK